MEWREVPDFEGLYEVNSEGKVRNARNGRELKPRLKDGYPTVTLSKKGRPYSRSIHLLVMAAFVGQRPKGYETCHYDGDKSNARLSNLRYGTRKDNWEDRKRLGELKSDFWTHGWRGKNYVRPIPKGWRKVELNG